LRGGIARLLEKILALEPLIHALDVIAVLVDESVVPGLLVLHAVLHRHGRDILVQRAQMRRSLLEPFAQEKVVGLTSALERILESPIGHDAALLAIGEVARIDARLGIY